MSLYGVRDLSLTPGCWVYMAIVKDAVTKEEGEDR